MALVVTLETYDVLVIGSGIAGVTAALEAARAGARVCLACQGPLFSGSSFYPGTWGLGLVGPRDTDDEADLARTIEAVGQGVADPELVATLVAGIRPAIAWLEELGVTLKRPSSAQSAAEAAFIPCFDHTTRLWRGITRESMTDVCRREIARREIDVHDGWELVDLLTEDAAGASEAADALPRLRVEPACAVRPRGTGPQPDGPDAGVHRPAPRVRGGIFHDRAAHRLVALPSRATVIATGGTSGLFARRLTAADVTGSAGGIALLHGCALTNIEFMQMMPGLIAPKRGLVFNEKSFRFARTDPALPAETLAERSAYGPFTARLASRAVDLAIAREGAQGMRVRYRFPREGVPEFVRTFCAWLADEQGIQPTEELRIALYAHASNGGIRIDADGRTGTPGLFAAGEATGGMHGADRIGGLSSANGLVFGRRAGRAAAAEAQALTGVGRDSADMASETVHRLAHVRLSAPESAAMTTELREAMQTHAMLPRTAEGLSEGLVTMARLAKRASGRAQSGAPAGAADNCLAGGAADDICRGARLRAQLLLARAMLTAMSERPESRGAHYRADAPAPDPRYARARIVRLQTP